jgi:drug/metabolite transporter (DMT)-like permease
MKKLANLNLIESILLLAIVGGTAGPLAKYALRSIPIFGYTSLRLLAGVIIMMIALSITKKKPSRENFIVFAPVATLWWLNTLFFTIGLQKTTATTAQFIHISIPIITALIAYVVLKERLNRNQLLSSLVAISGVSLVIASSGTLSFVNNTFLGNLFIALSAVVFSFYAVLSRKTVFKRISAMEMIFIASLSGLFVITPFALIEYQSNQWIDRVTAPTFLAMIGGVTAISVFYVGFQGLIKRFGPSIATTNLYVLPVTVTIWSFIILGEVASLKTTVGAIVAIVGVTLFGISTPKSKVQKR